MLSNTSPKVTAQTVTTIVVGGLVAGLIAAIGSITQAQLSGFGVWAPVVGVALTALAGHLSGYFITDPARVAGEPAPATVVHQYIEAPALDESTPAPELTTPAP